MNRTATASLLLSALIAGTGAFPGPAAASPAPPQDSGDKPVGPPPAAPGRRGDFDVRRGPDGSRTDEPPETGPVKERMKRKMGAVDAFRGRMPQNRQANLRVELHHGGTPKTLFSYDGPITGPRGGRPDDVARGFLRERADLFDLNPHEVDQLALEREDNGGPVTFVEYSQRIDGLRVYGGRIKAAVTGRGEIVSVNQGEVLPGRRVDTDPSVDELAAVALAFQFAGAEQPVTALSVVTPRAGRGDLAVYENPLQPNGMRTLVDLMVLPVGGEGRLAWRVFADAGAANYFEVLVDARSGELLKRTNLTRDAQGTVFTANPTRTPTRTVQQFGGAPIHGTTSPWCYDDDNYSRGWNAICYLDTDDNEAPDGATGNGLQQGFASGWDQNFTFPYTPGVDPRTQQAAALANLFYFVNAAHDFSYSIGFTETAGNFQANNWNLGGLEGDEVLAEAQDGSSLIVCPDNNNSPGACVNNANFYCAPEGQNPRMQMYLWTQGTATLADDRDSCFDGDIVFHEYGHGISNRLICAAWTGADVLNGLQSGALDEAWADYFAATYFSDGVVGEYVANNTARGIRRSAYGAASAVNDSYADLGTGTNSAGVARWETHDDGEVWCQILWEIRGRLGPRVADRLVVEGMKYTPDYPSFVNARDAIFTADAELNSSMNYQALWTIFARHGLGLSATGNDGTSHNAAYDSPFEPFLLNRIDCGGVTNGSLATTDGFSSVRPNCRRDRWQFRAEAGMPVTFNMDSTAFDTYLILFSPYGGQVAYDDDGGPGVNSQLTFVPPVSGTYSLEATSYYQNSTGAYTLTTRCDRLVFLPCAGSVYGSFTPADQISALRPWGAFADHYYFSGYPGMNVVITMSSTSGVDSYLYLKSPSGRIVAFDDDGGGYPNSRLAATLDESGTYVVEATEYGSAVQGSYTVAMTCS